MKHNSNSKAGTTADSSTKADGEIRQATLATKPLVSGSLSWQQASNILERHNRWRRGEDIPMENPTILGIAIDTVLNELESAMCYISGGELNFR
jgi:hypothetical protein